MNPDPVLPLDSNGAKPASSDAPVAGATDPGSGALGADAPPEPDAGPVHHDAGPIANECASAQGTLEPGTNVCLVVAATARVAWQEAMLACQSQNSTLVSIKTRARDDLLATLIASDIWIGAHDPGNDPAANAFVWGDGSPVAPIHWAPLEPDATADQFCVVKTIEPQRPWRDRACSDLKAYVCERTISE